MDDSSAIHNALFVWHGAVLSLCHGDDIMRDQCHRSLCVTNVPLWLWITNVSLWLWVIYYILITVWGLCRICYKFCSSNVNVPYRLKLLQYWCCICSSTMRGRTWWNGCNRTRTRLRPTCRLRASQKQSSFRSFDTRSFNAGSEQDSLPSTLSTAWDVTSRTGVHALTCPSSTTCSPVSRLSGTRSAANLLTGRLARTIDDSPTHNTRYRGCCDLIMSYLGCCY